jgi:hypothetical protein
MLLAICCVTMVASAESKYENVTADLGDGLGALDVSVLCHHNLFSQEVRWKLAGETDWNNSFYLSPDGTYDGRYPPGHYDLWLIDGNGGHWELRYDVEVKAGYWTMVRFIGHAVSGHGNETTPVPTTVPTTIPTIVPTTEPTVVPTIIPTVSPTVTPKPCTTTTVWVQGYWTIEHRWTCEVPSDWLQLSCWCKWVDVPVWNEGYWETHTFCPS